MKHKFNRIPQELQNAIIGFGGSLPGVGKSYTKNAWAEKLSSLGYQVIVTGSTNKASEGHKTIYSVADWTDMKKTRELKTFVRKEGRVFPERSAFIMIDEAWMLSQEDLEQLKKQFPKCCFLIFGDPNQFPPIEDKKTLNAFDNLKKDQYDVMLAEIRKSIKKGIIRKKIYDVDLLFNLTKQYRVKTPELKRVLANIRAGFADIEDILIFMQKHQYHEFDDVDFAICRTWDSGVYKWADYASDGKKRKFRSFKSGVKGVYVGQNNIGAIKNAIYDMKGQSFDSDSQITDMSVFTDEMNYAKQGAVTCHSIQGSTFRKGVKVVVDVDNALSIMDDVYGKEKEDLYADFQKFMYIACSRVQEEEDIVFKCEELEKFCKIAGWCREMESPRNAVETSSEELCRAINPIDLLLSEVKKRNIVVKKGEAQKRKGRIQFDVKEIFSRLTVPQLEYIYSFNSVSEGQCLGCNELQRILGISERTFYRHKKEIYGYLNSLIAEKKKEEKKVYTTGKTIGEILEEEEKEEKSNGKEYAYSLLEKYRKVFGENKTYKVTKEWVDKEKEWNETSKECVQIFLQVKIYGEDFSSLQ